MIVHTAGELTFHQLVLNEIKTNCYIIQKGSEALLIDPTHDAPTIAKYFKDHDLTLKFMLATHGHFDHVSAAADLIDQGLANVLYVHEKDFAEIKRGPLYSSVVFKRNMRIPKVEKFSDEVFALLCNWGLVVTHAGGHTKGSCYIHDKEKSFIVTGDLVLHHKLRITLFNVQENIPELVNFISSIRADFPPETVILPGHGNLSTLALESAHNPKWEYVLKKNEVAGL